MPGPKPKYPIHLLDNQIPELRKLIHSRKASQGKVMRAKVILAAAEHPEWSNQKLAREVGYTDRAVRKRRRRWVQTQSLENLPIPGALKCFSLANSHAPSDRIWINSPKRRKSASAPSGSTPRLARE